jgi:hypothetical protein
MKNYTSIGLSLSTATAKQIDKDRGKISRSLYLREVIERGLAAAAGAAAIQTK